MNWLTYLQNSSSIWVPAGLLIVGAVILIIVIALPSREISVDRRRQGVAAAPSGLTRAADASMNVVERLLSRRRERAEAAANALELAGIRRSLPEFVLLVAVGAVVAAAAGMVLGGPLIALFLTGLTIFGVFVVVNLRAGNRREDFADQLDDMVQLLASNLRAGHSVLQAMDSLTQELEDPAASEIARVVNQVRVGRDFSDALTDAAQRMDSDDFRWISQAISIHRQVGGNLAEVMDTVGETIRERNQIRGQVTALSAEGKLSAYILVALPFVVALLMSFLNPGYIGTLTESIVGLGLLAVAAVFLVIGSWWLSKIVKIRF